MSAERHSIYLLPPRRPAQAILNFAPALDKGKARASDDLVDSRCTSPRRSGISAAISCTCKSDILSAPMLSKRSLSSQKVTIELPQPNSSRKSMRRDPNSVHVVSWKLTAASVRAASATSSSKYVLSNSSPSQLLSATKDLSPVAEKPLPIAAPAQAAKSTATVRSPSRTNHDRVTSAGHSSNASPASHVRPASDVSSPPGSHGSDRTSLEFASDRSARTTSSPASSVRTPSPTQEVKHRCPSPATPTQASPHSDRCETCAPTSPTAPKLVKRVSFAHTHAPSHESDGETRRKTKSALSSKTASTSGSSSIRDAILEDAQMESMTTAQVVQQLKKPRAATIPLATSDIAAFSSAMESPLSPSEDDKTSGFNFPVPNISSAGFMFGDADSGDIIRTKSNENSPTKTSSPYDPFEINRENAVLAHIDELPRYVNRVLRKLNIPRRARMDFISVSIPLTAEKTRTDITRRPQYWMPRFSNEAYVALRVLPRAEFEADVPLTIKSKSAVSLHRIFILFRRVTTDEAVRWIAPGMGNILFDWTKIAGSSFRELSLHEEHTTLEVLELGGMDTGSRSIYFNSI